jgi:GNAT superfamily N-acetyltransferase
MNDILIRSATVDDIPFIVEAIINAEKSGTEILSYTTISGLTEEETRCKLAEILKEETDGCELSVSSFLLAEVDGKVAAGLGAWIEGSGGISSQDLKRDLICCFFPESCFKKAASASPIVDDLDIPRSLDTIQIEIVYVKPEYRGYKLSGLLLNKQIERLLLIDNNISEVEVKIMGNNIPSIKAFANLGFYIALEKKSENPDANLYLPSNTRLLLKRDINI